MFGDSAVVRCTEEDRPGVLVTLTDAATGEPISGATLTLTEDGFEWILVESSSSIIPGVYAGVSERPGIYTLFVRADGYHDVVREIVVVEEDTCHVQTVSVDVQMTANDGSTVGRLQLEFNGLGWLGAGFVYEGRLTVDHGSEPHVF